MLISVIIPVYNAHNYLSHLFSNLLEQTYKEFEVILVLNDPTTEEKTIIGTFRDKMAIVTIEVPKELPTISLNRGLMLAKGDVIVVTGVDDYFRKEAFQRYVETFAVRPDADIVYSDYTMVREGKDSLDITTPEFDITTMRTAYFIGAHQVFRSKIVEQEEVYKDDYWAACDYEFYMRLATKGYKFYRIPELLSYFTVRPTSLTRQSIAIHSKTVRRIQDEYR